MGAGRWAAAGCAVIGFTNPGGSELAQLMPIQDMLNKSDLDTIAASDAAGFSYGSTWPAWKRR